MQATQIGKDILIISKHDFPVNATVWFRTQKMLLKVSPRCFQGSEFATGN